ncbi:MAG TPA: tyrosine-type recombinase/integrase, partial [Flavipsychrobacter sp.]|nr:tyrosine-type recombinase/integrase [Flavipsychrobacter sp.]
MTGEEIKQHLLSFGITPSKALHYDKEVVKLLFGKDLTLTSTIKKHEGRWSKTLNGWYVAKSKKLLIKIIKAIAEQKGTDIERNEIKEMKRRLQLKSYSENTIRTYTQAFSLFLDHFYGKDIGAVTKDEIETYLLHLSKEKEYSESALHSMVNAIKFYYEQALKKPKEFYQIERPKKPMQIPRMFAKEDIEKLLKATTNLKHKTILMVCYSSGLRVSEVATLKVNAIDSKRMVINILNAKGKKDRIVPLSKTTLKYLREYYTAYKPKEYMFEGHDGKEAYSTRSIQAILKQAKLKANINKPGSV